MNDRKELIISIAIVAVLVFSLAFLSHQGMSGRHFSEPFFEAVSEPSEAFHIWQENRIRGRILYHFDNTLNARGNDFQINNTNFILHAVKRNIFRKVYHIVPDDARWDNIRAQLINRPSAHTSGNYLRLTIKGVPLIIARVKDITPTREKVCINIDTASSDPLLLMDLLANGTLRTDCFTASGESSSGLAFAIRETYER